MICCGCFWTSRIKPLVGCTYQFCHITIIVLWKIRFCSIYHSPHFIHTFPTSIYANGTLYYFIYIFLLTTFFH